MKNDEKQSLKKWLKPLMLSLLGVICWSSNTLKGESSQVMALRAGEDLARQVAQLYASQESLPGVGVSRPVRGVASVLDGGSQVESHDGLIGLDPWGGAYAFRISQREAGGFRVEIRSAGPNRQWEKEPSDDLTMTLSF